MSLFVMYIRSQDILRELTCQDIAKGFVSPMMKGAVCLEKCKYYLHPMYMTNNSIT